MEGSPLKLSTGVLQEEDSSKEGDDSEVIKVYIFKAETDDDVDIGEGPSYHTCQLSCGSSGPKKRHPSIYLSLSLTSAPFFIA